MAVAKAKGKHLGRPNLNLKTITKLQRLHLNKTIENGKRIQGVHFAEMLQLKKKIVFIKL